MMDPRLLTTVIALARRGDATGARLLEEEIAALGRQARVDYIRHLSEAIGCSQAEPWTALAVFALLRATPEQRARAFAAARGLP